jgi:hypothetical protein
VELDRRVNGVDEVNQTWRRSIKAGLVAMQEKLDELQRDWPTIRAALTPKKKGRPVENRDRDDRILIYRAIGMTHGEIAAQEGIHTRLVAEALARKQGRRKKRRAG